MNSLNDKFAGVKATVEELPKTLKAVGVIGSLCGFFYLFAYTRAVGIPFPLELSVLPTALLLIGVVSILGTAMVVSGVLIPAVLADDPLDVTKTILLATDTEGNRILSRAKRYVICAWIPMAMALVGLLFLVGVFDIRPWTSLATILLVGAAICWIVGTAHYVVTQKNKRAEYIATMLGQTLLSVFAYLLAVMIFLALVPEFGKWEAWGACLLVLAVFTPVHFLVTMPNDGKMGKKILMPPYYEFRATPATATAFGILAFFVALSVFVYPVNAKVGKSVLYAFSAGGGIPIIVCLKDVPPSQISQRISFNGDKCSEPLVAIFDAGDRVYVAKPIPKENDRAKESLAVVEPIYFRQDQILEKIYLPENNRKRGRQVSP